MSRRIQNNLFDTHVIDPPHIILSKLAASHFTAVHRYFHPHPAVVKVFLAVQILVGEENPSWENALEMVKDKLFLS